jgi:hypothetical protein
VRIHRTTRSGVSPHPISMTTPTGSSVRSDHGRPPLPAVLAYCGLQATLPGLGAALVSDAARAIPLAAVRHAVREGEVNT